MLKIFFHNNDYIWKGKFIILIFLIILDIGRQLK